MCSLIGALLAGVRSNEALAVANATLEHIWRHSHERGRDGRGWWINSTSESHPAQYGDVTRNNSGEGTNPPALRIPFKEATVIGNLRAEPTTEYVKQKRVGDQQPYACGKWAMVHNGTVANDRALRTNRLGTAIDSAAIAEQLAIVGPEFSDFVGVINKIKGSYAILAAHEDFPGRLYVAANYRPLWFIQTPVGVFFASSRDYLPWKTFVPQMLMPYTAALFTEHGIVEQTELYPTHDNDNRKALVVCSGGLDSVVSATIAKEAGMQLHLIHFLYGSRAEGPEVDAVRAVAKHLEAELTLFPLNIYRKEDSPLLDPNSKVAGGEEGAEFAHEWVPARNLVMLSVATAFAEARGIGTIVLGNNLEEAGAYPDNEPEFISRFNDMLPFAVGDGKRMRVVMPVGNLMKHEIVALGKLVKAPMHLTWSCYRAGEKHCGTCGPCYMRRRAFEINQLEEVIEYAHS